MPDEVHSGGYPHQPNLEMRVSSIETRLERLESIVDEIRKEMQAVRIDLARMDGKISNLPTTFQLLYMQAGLILAVFAAAFAVMRLGGTH
jgi:uncharacterized coiled-coil protein SlyX